MSLPIVPTVYIGRAQCCPGMVGTSRGVVGCSPTAPAHPYQGQAALSCNTRLAPPAPCDKKLSCHLAPWARAHGVGGGTGSASPCIPLQDAYMPASRELLSPPPARLIYFFSWDHLLASRTTFVLFHIMDRSFHSVGQIIGAEEGEGGKCVTYLRTRGLFIKLVSCLQLPPQQALAMSFLSPEMSFHEQHFLYHVPSSTTAKAVSFQPFVVSKKLQTLTLCQLKMMWRAFWEQGAASLHHFTF